MEIIPPKNFTDGRKVKVKFTKYDPRVHSFPASLVIINLTRCSTIHTQAILWCMIFLSQWKQRGYSCLLILPNSDKAASHLIDSGILRILKEQDIDIWEEGYSTYPSGSADVVLPLTRFDNLGEAAELTNTVEDSLISSGLGSANVHPVVCEQFSELVNNAAEHSRSRVGAYGFVRFSQSRTERRFECCIADGGMGIRKSLEQNATLNHFGYDWLAIDFAIKELVSGTGLSNRGIGLFSIVEEMRAPGRELIIHSGYGILTINQDPNQDFHVLVTPSLFPGTMVYLSIPA